ncbi:MAG TPA: helix-turn-helix domain-containing protein [Chitinophagaceae bacterium]|nr:helix-turn-helix domain-containing protein [Chitinophagaceae bacterium]
MKNGIKSKKDYHQMMLDIYQLMNKGESNLTRTELKKLEKMSAMAEMYEDEILKIRPRIPKSIAEAVELKMFENKMSQAKLADELGLGKSKVSEILSGKRKPDIAFLKGVYQVLKIDAEFLLEHA